MGVCGAICNFILGPLLIYFILMGHVAYQTFKSPSELDVPAWPSQATAQEKNAIIASRKPIIKDLMDVCAGKNGKFAQQYATEDVEFEDPMQRFIGFKEVSQFLSVPVRHIKNAEFEIHGEHHAPHEIIMDWTIKVRRTTGNLLRND